MKKRLMKYLEFWSLLDIDTLTAEEKNRRKADLLVNISFFQHERLIHLIVTALFALMTVLGLLLFLQQPSFLTLGLEGLFLALLIPYIVHYYYLENGVQKLYTFYDRL